MTADKQLRTAKPGTLLSQWWTLGAIALDKRTAGRHITVAWVIIDRHMQRRGNSRASLRYIEKATGLSKPTVIGACRELVEWGYFSRHLGEGTRPSEYAPNWLAVNPSLPQASGQQGFTAGGKDGLTTTTASGQQGLTKNLLTSPAYRPADRNVGNMNTLAPLADGLAATAGARDPESASPKDAFDRFWSAFPRRYQKPKARAAWEKLNPNAGLTERIIVAAGEWADHYDQNPVDKKWMPTPANWLSGERYDEDLPSVYVDPKEAAIAKAKDRPAKPPRPAAVGDRKPPQKRSMRVVDIVDVELEEVSITHSIFRFTFCERDTPETWKHEININHPKYEVQEEAQKEFAKLTRALGVGDVESEEQLKALSRRPVTVMPRYEGGLDYAAAPKANYQLVDELDDEDDDLDEAA